MLRALVKLLGRVLGRGAAQVLDEVDAIEASAPVTSLSGRDVRIQNEAARSAGPRCDSIFMGLRCARTRGHRGLHESSDGSGWDDEAAVVQRCSSFLLDRIGPGDAREPVVYRCTLDEGHAGQHITPHGRRWPPP